MATATKPRPPLISGEFWFDTQAAAQAINFFPKFLRHAKGEWAGQSIKLQLWQQDIVSKIFGWKRQNGTRRYRTVYIEIPRKNGKSTLIAGLGLYMFLCDREAGAEVYAVAAEREQARKTLFDPARYMVESHPELAKRAQRFKNTIVCQSTRSVFQVISAEAPTKHGFNAHCVLFDELHMQPNRDLWDVLTTSTGSRRQPLVVAITTAGFDKHSICYELHDYAVKVRDGVYQDDTFLPVIYGAEENEDWKDPEVRARVNPNLGVSLKKDYLDKEFQKALELPNYENTFKRLHLNIWTEQDIRWMAMEKWEACAEKIPEESLEHQYCYGGLDLAMTTDMSAFVLLFPPQAGRDKWAVLPFYWVPEADIAVRSRRDHVPYSTWARQGVINTTPGNVIDHDFIEKKIIELNDRYQIRRIAYDPTRATQVVTHLQSILGTEMGPSGKEEERMVPINQTANRMNAGIKSLEKLVLGKELAHGGHPVLRWNAANAVLTSDSNGNVKFDKRKATERIDGMVALAMAVGRASLEPPPSIYEDIHKRPNGIVSI